MKQFAFKWLKRLYLIVAFNFVLLAILISSARILFVSIADYKEQAINWLTSTYQVEVSIDDISAGIDFSGMVLILDDVTLLNSDELPFTLTFDNLLIHLNFWDSVANNHANFDHISLQGAQLILKNEIANSDKSEEITARLKDFFLTQLKKVTIKDSYIHFTNQFGQKKQIIVEELNWLNIDDHHQGVGSASFPNAFGRNSMEFLIELSPEQADIPLEGYLYIQADHVNITDYLLGKVNDTAKMIDAQIGGEAWFNFSFERIKSMQLKLNNSQFVWSQLQKKHYWQINSGLIQVTNSEGGWLLDSYDLDIKHNKKQLQKLSVSGQGNALQANLDFNELTLQHLIPFYLLTSKLNQTEINSLQKLGVDAQIKQLQLQKNADDWSFAVNLQAFKNKPVGAIPGVSHADVVISGGVKSGGVDIVLAKQKLYFDGQFSRTMPIKSGELKLQWQQTETGLNIFSQQASLVTNDLDTITDFSLFLPNEKASNKSPFLSLSSYASLNDASKAQYYFPIKAMGNNVFNYLQPTIKKGHVQGAKILWYGAFNHYPYQGHNGIFQAWVPLRNAQYDFYGEWQGLTDLDLDLLFENDYLKMNAKKATLGDVKIGTLTAKVDHLNPNGVLTINANITDDALNISNYLKASPLKKSVGQALEVVEVKDKLSGNLKLSIPFNRKTKQAQSSGEIRLNKNSINIALSDSLIMPLEKVSGKFSFINGDLTANKLQAILFEQPINLSFTTAQALADYQVNAQVDGVWQVAPLIEKHTFFEPVKLSGQLDWSSDVNFKYQYQTGYQFEVTLDSAMQGILSDFPPPLYKNPLQTWPTKVVVSGSQNHTQVNLTIEDKLAFIGALNYQDELQSIPYFNFTLGKSEIISLDKSKQVVNLQLDNLDVTPWYYHLIKETKEKAKATLDEPYLQVENISLDEINFDIKQLKIFQQPLSLFTLKMHKNDNRWEGGALSDNLQTRIEYRPGTPVRWDLNIKKVNFQDLDLSELQKETLITDDDSKGSKNLRVDYPELFVSCEFCVYKDIDLSPLSLHLYPTKKRLNIDYLNIGDEDEFTNITGFWDQRITNIILDTEAGRDNNIVKRFGFVSPVSHKKAQFSGAFNWIGAPWQANLGSLNGAFSSELSDGLITEVSDKGARLLSIFSLDGIRRSLNSEFDNVFSKGFYFEVLKLTGNINDGIISNDDFYLDGSAGKITGEGLIDLPNQNTNYKFSYSPDVTSSLPVLAAFAINPLTGAAVLMLTKIFEPAVEAIIRVDFTVKGSLTNPDVKLVTQQQGKIKLEKSEVLDTMNKMHKNTTSPQVVNQAGEVLETHPVKRTHSTVERAKALSSKRKQSAVKIKADETDELLLKQSKRYER